MSSAESDKYIQNQRKLKHAGVDINVTSTKEDLVSLAGIPITPGPRIILSSSFAITQRELFNKIGSGNRISNRSSLVVDGENIHIMNLNLDGALVIRTGEDCHVTIDGLVVHNKGYEFVEVDSSSGSEVPEEVVIRGYTMEKHEVMEIIITEAVMERL
jgi:UDP-sugar pyrophosphorylase